MGGGGVLWGLSVLGLLGFRDSALVAHLGGVGLPGAVPGAAEKWRCLRLEAQGVWV